MTNNGQNEFPTEMGTPDPKSDPLGAFFQHQKRAVEESVKAVEALLPEEDYYAFHVNAIAHGRQTCTARNPACPRCPVLELCPFTASHPARL